MAENNELELIIRAKAAVSDAFNEVRSQFQKTQAGVDEFTKQAQKDIESFNYTHYRALTDIGKREAEQLGLEQGIHGRRHQLMNMSNEDIERLYQSHQKFAAQAGQVQSSWQSTVTALSTGFLAVAEAAEFAFSIVRGGFELVFGLARTFIGAVQGAVEATMKWGEGLHQLTLELGVTASQAATLQGIGSIFGMTAQTMGRSFGLLLMSEDKASAGMGKFAGQAQSSANDLEHYQYQVHRLTVEIDKLNKAQNVGKAEKTRDRELKDAAFSMKELAEQHKQTMDDITTARQDALDNLAAHTLAGDDAKYKRDADKINDRYDLQEKRAKDTFEKEKEQNAQHVSDIKERSTEIIADLKSNNADRLVQLKDQLKQDAELRLEHAQKIGTVSSGGFGGGGMTALQRLLSRIGPELKIGTGNMADFYTQLGLIRSELEKMPAQEKTAALMELMRRGGTEMVEVLSLEDSKWKLVQEDMHRLHLDSPKLIEDTHELRFAQGRLANAIEGVKVNIGEGLVPAFTHLNDKMTEWIMKHVDTFQKAGQALGDFLGKAIDPLFKVLDEQGPRILSNIKQGLVDIINAITGGHFKSLTDVFDHFQNIKGDDIKSAFSKIADGASTAANSLQTVATALRSIGNAFAWIKEKTDGLENNAVTRFLGELSFNLYSPGNPNIYRTRATGGFASGQTLVGERGPELVNLPAGSYVHTAEQSKKMSGGGQTINNTFNIRNDSDPTAIARFLAFQLSHAGRF